MGYEAKRGIGHIQEQQRLRNFAGRVTDEAHFQRILDDTKPGYRDAVEAALRPWLRFTTPTPAPEQPEEDPCASSQ